MVATVFMLFLTVSGKKNKVRLISEFSYLALGQIRKLGNLRKIYLSVRNDLNFICMTCDGSNCFHAFLNCFRTKEQSLTDFRNFRVFVFSIRANSKTRNLGKIFLSFRNDLNFISNYALQF